jgi:hypothetical protein
MYLYFRISFVSVFLLFLCLLNQFSSNLYACFSFCRVSFCYVCQFVYHNTIINKQLQTRYYRRNQYLFTKHTRYMFRPYVVIIRLLKILKILSTYIIGLFIAIDPLLLVPIYTTHSSIQYLQYIPNRSLCVMRILRKRISAVSSSLVCFLC